MISLSCVLCCCLTLTIYVRTNYTNALKMCCCCSVFFSSVGWWIQVLIQINKKLYTSGEEEDLFLARSTSSLVSLQRGSKVQQPQQHLPKGELFFDLYTFDIQKSFHQFIEAKRREREVRTTTMLSWMANDGWIISHAKKENEGEIKSKKNVPNSAFIGSLLYQKEFLICRSVVCHQPCDSCLPTRQ